METEFEAKAPEIDKDAIRRKLTELGAILVYIEKKIRRITWDIPLLKDQNGWLRLRDEGDIITLSLKLNTNSKSLSGLKEITITVDNFENTKTLIESIGLIQNNYEENYREEWKIGNVKFEIDTWPLIPPFLEIEAPNEDLIKVYFKKLDLDYESAIFGPASEIYNNYGIDLLQLKTVTFDEGKL